MAHTFGVQVVVNAVSFFRTPTLDSAMKPRPTSPCPHPRPARGCFWAPTRPRPMRRSSPCPLAVARLVFISCFGGSHAIMGILLVFPIVYCRASNHTNTMVPYSSYSHTIIYLKYTWKGCWKLFRISGCRDPTAASDQLGVLGSGFLWCFQNGS